MTHPHLRMLAAAQDDLVGIWQLVSAGWTPKQVSCRTAGLDRVHDGVVRTSFAPLTEHQRHLAATLTTPESTLSHASAAAFLGIRAWPRYGGSHTIITRPGSGGPSRIGTLLVMRSSVLSGATMVLDGVRTTTPERTLLDLAAIGRSDLRKPTREALRKKLTTIPALRQAIIVHKGRQGTARLSRLVERYANLRLDRCKSDAEALAIEQLLMARLPLPAVNSDVAGVEADLYYEDLGLVIEIDGPQFHLHKDEDARKTTIWMAAGLAVERVPSDDVFLDPDRVPEIVRRYRRGDR